MQINSAELDKLTIAIIGLGYVGLPLAIEFGKFHNVIAFDINESRIDELQNGLDRTLEVSAEKLQSVKNIEFTSQLSKLKFAQIFIITVPTPVNISKQPDLWPLINASQIVGKALKIGDIVVYESTVYPGCTEEVCVPVLEKFSGLQFNRDFYCGYSPERINPGDKEHHLSSIVKITSGSTPEIAIVIDKLYSKIILAGTHRAGSIKVAEAAKVIENTQRDINIALMNELSLIFYRLNIDTLEVLEAAKTKWNFLPFRPGLVGGHCIGVDPYYLTFKAQELGYQPEIILAGRRINDGMASHIAEIVIKGILKKGLPVIGGKVLILGLTFKENCPDIRNTKVIDIVRALEAFSFQVHIYDPLVDIEEARSAYGLDCLVDLPKAADYSAVILAVGHEQFFLMGEKAIRDVVVKNGIFFDVKGIFPLEASDGRL